MRPCNRCRRPIENAKQLCPACEEYHRERGLEVKRGVSMRPHDPATERPLPLHRKVNLMLAGFALSTLIFCSLLGLVAAGRPGLAVGVIVAFALTWMFSMSIRG